MTKNAKPTEITPAEPRKDLTPEERERITVVHALRTGGGRVYRGTMDAIAAMTAIITTAPANFVTESFIRKDGWTVVVHPPLAKRGIEEV